MATFWKLIDIRFHLLILFLNFVELVTIVIVIVIVIFNPRSILLNCSFRWILLLLLLLLILSYNIKFWTYFIGLLILMRSIVIHITIIIIMFVAWLFISSLSYLLKYTFFKLCWHFCCGSMSYKKLIFQKFDLISQTWIILRFYKCWHIQHWSHLFCKDILKI